LCKSATTVVDVEVKRHAIKKTTLIVVRTRREKHIKIAPIHKNIMAIKSTRRVRRLAMLKSTRNWFCESILKSRFYKL
jgi:hypothetical protein